MTTPPPPPPAAADTGAGASVVSGGSGTSIKRRHSRGRSITSRSDMVPSRPSSAKTKVEGATPWSDHTQTVSPAAHEVHTREAQVREYLQVYSSNDVERRGHVIDVM